MLHAHRTHPGLFDALLLQSGSFFTPELDRAGGALLRLRGGDRIRAPCIDRQPPTRIRCRRCSPAARVEENLANNREMAATLRRLGYPTIDVDAVRDAHNYTAWRDALDPASHRADDDAGGCPCGVIMSISVRLMLIAYGHYGRPVLVFPSEQGRAWDFENNGMVGAVADLIDAGRVKLYCVDSADAYTWSDRSVPIEERARRHSDYESLGARIGSCPGSATTAAGRSRSPRWVQPRRVPRRELRAQARRRVPARAVPVAATTTRAPGTRGANRGDATYFNNPMALRRRTWKATTSTGCASGVSLLLVVGQGAWEVDPTGALPSTPCVRGSSCATRAFDTSSTCGDTTCRTTGRPGGPSSVITYRDSAEERNARGPPT